MEQSRQTQQEGEGELNQKISLHAKFQVIWSIDEGVIDSYLGDFKPRSSVYFPVDQNCDYYVQNITMLTSLKLTLYAMP